MTSSKHLKRLGATVAALLLVFAWHSLTGRSRVTHRSEDVTAPRMVVVVPKASTLGDRLLSRKEAAGMDSTAFTQSVLVVDGDVIKEFDPKLTLRRTLRGEFKAPESVAMDPLGRFYVADTGHDRIVRLLADGTVDPSFASGGQLSVKRPLSILLERVFDQEHVLTINILIGTDHDQQHCSGRTFECVTQRSTPAERLVRTDDLMGEGPLWFLSKGVLIDEDSPSEPRSIGADGLDAAVDLRAYNPWWVVLRPGGRLEESFGVGTNRRVTSLGFDATSVAIDGSADFILEHGFGDEDTRNVTGPHAIYVAGPGRIERRVVPKMSGGIW